MTAQPEAQTVHPALSLYYRGTLSSCNYDCAYCPFAKRRDSRARLAQDAVELTRFIDWIETRPDLRLRIAFTPWGEALVRRHYRDGIARLTTLTQIEQVTAQTNLCGPLSWLEALDPVTQRPKLALWTTFHPSQTTLARFLARCAWLRTLGVAHSVGVVAMKAHFGDIARLRAALPAGTFVWLNAWDRAGRDHYSADEVAWLSSIDPWFPHSVRPSVSRGRPCRTGEEVLLIDGAGEARRCHLIAQRLGNLYTDALETMLQPRACSLLRCDCFIGHAHRRDLPFYDDFGPAGVLSRRPLHWPAPGPGPAAASSAAQAPITVSTQTDSACVCGDKRTACSGGS